MTIETTQSGSVKRLLKDEQYAPLREKLIEERILTIDDLKSISLWTFLNSHDLYPIRDRQTICENVLDLIRSYPSDESEEAKTDDIITPYWQVFGLDPSDYEQLSIDDCDLSVRAHNRLMGNKVRTVAALLKLSDSDLLALKGFGNQSVSDVRLFLKKLSRGGTRVQSDAVEPEQYAPILYKYREQLISGDFSFVDENSVTPALRSSIMRFREAHEILEPDLIQAVANGSSSAIDIYQVLLNYIEQTNQECVCDAVVQSLPQNYLALDASFVARCYTSNYHSLPINAIGATPGEGETLRQFIYNNASLVIQKDPRFKKFLSWCCSDVRTELNRFIDTKLEKDRVRLIFRGRARGEKLGALGDQIGITRERVRQVEAKVIRTAHNIFSRDKYIYKLFLDFGSPNITGAAIEEYVGEYGKEAVYLLKEYSDHGYYYDHRMDLFSLDQLSQETGIYEEIYGYIDSLPELFGVDKLDQYVEEGNKKYGLSDTLLRLLLLNNYRRTGDTYHRSRLSLAVVYSEILRKFYPDGIHIDDEEINRFRCLVKDELGIDLGDRSNHAVISIISRTGILCGRGRYKYREDKEYLSPELKKRIHTYISTNPLPVLLINSVYSEFEEDLAAEGVDNRYYLQGILKEAFGDEWSFRRDYISKDSAFNSFYDAVTAFVSKAKTPVAKAEIKNHFPGITDIVLNMALSDPETLNLFGLYINASRLRISESDIRYLHRQIELSLCDHDICYVRELFDKINLEYPELLSRNYITIPFGLFSLLEYLFSGDYNFSRPFIAREGSEIRSIASVLREMVAESDVISIGTILDFASEHHYSIASVLEFAAQCNGTHLMINDQELASFEYIGMTQEIAREVERQIKAEITAATPIAHLTCLGQLPKLNVEWNTWLIYSLLRKWSQDLTVGTSKSYYKQAYPIVAPAGSPLEIDYDESISHNGYLVIADDMDDIDELISDFSAEDWGDMDEL